HAQLSAPGIAASAGKHVHRDRAAAANGGIRAWLPGLQSLGLGQHPAQPQGDHQPGALAGAFVRIRWAPRGPAARPSPLLHGAGRLRTGADHVYRAGRRGIAQQAADGGQQPVGTGRAMQRFVVLGINHKFAPLEVRERLSYPDRRIPAALKTIRERADCEEAVLLSTCNRVEVYAFTEGEDARERLLRGLAADHSMKPEFLEQYCYFHRGRDAVEHLIRVAGGLDSLVLGETQILSQVKKAYLLAQPENATGKALNGLFHRAFQAAKRLHTETGIGEGQLSVSATAVRFVKR